jgi:hypothetical protein
VDVFSLDILFALSLFPPHTLGVTLAARMGRRRFDAVRWDEEIL